LNIRVSSSSRSLLGAILSVSDLDIKPIVYFRNSSPFYSSSSSASSSFGPTSSLSLSSYSSLTSSTFWYWSLFNVSLSDSNLLADGIFLCMSLSDEDNSLSSESCELTESSPESPS
jgi:hypothetical protein